MSDIYNMSNIRISCLQIQQGNWLTEWLSDWLTVFITAWYTIAYKNPKVVAFFNCKSKVRLFAKRLKGWDKIVLSFLIQIHMSRFAREYIFFLLHEPSSSWLSLVMNRHPTQRKSFFKYEYNLISIIVDCSSYNVQL